jgi:hypothetical protein
MGKTEYFKEIYEFIETLPVFSDHEHHREDDFFIQGMSLDKALKNSYVAWTGYLSDDSSYKSRMELLDNVRFNSYFTWFEKGVQKVHSIEESITPETWDGISEKITSAYKKDPDFHWKALLKNGYERLVQDSYWNPGSDNGHPETLVPTFRIDNFMCGYHEEAMAPDDIIPWQWYGFNGGSLENYVDLMFHIISTQHEKGKVAALKCAKAYYRSICFLPDDKAEATKAFNLHPDIITEDQKIIFGNYIFNRCCELATKLDVPFQVHTGLARISGSQPMRFEPVIVKHPNTRFVLFHSGFPWTHEVAGLSHNYNNVLPSLTWTATICTSSAIRALDDYIDVAPSINTITWGSDCLVPEDSIGALLAWRFIVATVISKRMDDKRIRNADAEVLARKLMYENGRNIYKQNI